MKCRTAILLLSFACAGGAGAVIPVAGPAGTLALPDREIRILGGVAEEYGLSASGLKLLLAIRRIENGRTGLEMGVGPNYPRHPARRFARNPDRSLRVQARWAAGTIRLRYTGNIDAFARRYCPHKWRHWARLARYWMSQPAAGEARRGDHKLPKARPAVLTPQVRTFGLLPGIRAAGPAPALVAKGAGARAGKGRGHSPTVGVRPHGKRPTHRAPSSPSK